MMNLTGQPRSRTTGPSFLARLVEKMLPRPPLQIRIGTRLLSFRNLADFEFAVSGKTALPADKFAELMGRSAEQLKTEALSIKAVEQRFSEALEGSLDHPETTRPRMTELSLKLFSKDHNWREIIEALNGSPQVNDDYRRIALAKYLQYLAARQETLNTLYWLKTRNQPRDELVDTANPIPRTMFKETVIFDVSNLESSRRMLNALERLPRGEPVVLKLQPGEAMELILVKHRFKLTGGETWHLVDESGMEFPLQEGRNTVGRDSTNAVVLDNAYRVVSRRHLVLEPMSASKIRVTDLSSHGTFVSPQYFDRDVGHQAA